jgi:hypothetical protein
MTHRKAIRQLASVIPAEAALRAAVWSAFLVILTFTSADPDLWGHVRFGTDILHNGSIHQVDTYSFASDRAWVNHEWGAEVLAAWAFGAAGNAGLVSLKLLIVGSVLLLLNAALRQEGIHSAFLRDVTAGVAIVITLSQAHHVRPQLFSLLLFSALLSCLLSVRRGSYRSLLILPALFAIWANLHGGWIVGGAVVVVWAAALLIAGDRLEALLLIVAGALSFLATLVTPYGLGLWEFLRATVGLSRPEIIEWQPVYSTGWEFVALWFIAFTIMTAGLVFSGRRSIRAERLATGLALAVASLKVARLLAFFGLASVFLFAPLIGQAYQQRRAARSFGRSPALRLGFVGAACALAFFTLGIVYNNFGHLRLDAASLPEPEAVALLHHQPAGKRVLVWFNWGEYAIWHLSPRMQVSIDGRRETVYSEKLQTRHFDFYFDRPGGTTLPNDLGADYVWIPRILPAARRLRSDSGWQPIFEGKQSVIFERAALARQTPTASVVLAAAATPRVFPGP